MPQEDYKSMRRNSKMNNTITLPNGRIFDLEKDDLTTEDYRCLSGEQVRYIRSLQQGFVLARCLEKQREYGEKGILVACM